MVRHQQGQSAQAVELISRAVAVRPSVAPFHANLAEAYRALGQLDRAVGCCRAALALSGKTTPKRTTTWGWRSRPWVNCPRPLEHYEAALAFRPTTPRRTATWGPPSAPWARSSRRFEHFKKAVELNPKLASARTNLGQFLLDLGRAEEALPHCREAVALEPNLAEAHNNLGNAYRARSSIPTPGPATSRRSGSTPTWPRPTSTWGSPSSRKGVPTNRRRGSGGRPSSTPRTWRSGGSTPMC